MRIRTKFILFMMIFVTSVFMIMYLLSLRVSRNRIIEDIGNHINTAVKFKAQNIETLLIHYKEITELLAVGVPIVQYFNASIDYETREKNLKTRISNTVKINDSITRIRLLDAKGIVVASSHEDIGMDRSYSRIFQEGKKGTYIWNLHFLEFTEEYVISIATPIYTNGKVSGVLIINFAALKQLFPIIADRTGLIHSTDIYLLNKDHYLISPTRYEDTILETKIDPEQIWLCYDDHIKNIIPEMDLKKQMLYINYRGNKVLGTHSYISMMQWFLIVEVNEADLVRPIMKYRNLLAVLFSIILILSLGVSYIISIFLTKPIKKLEAGIQEIIKGNLNYKVATKSKDEIGQLSRVFDDMTTRLINSQKELENHAEVLEEQVKERTAELEKKIEERKQQRHAILNVAADLETINVDLQKEIETRLKAEEQIKRDLEEKNVLLQEVHHRVKNNMQIISSLLKLQSAHIKDKRALELFQNSRDRVKTMALIHDALYRSKDLAHIDFTDYVRKLTTQIFISYGANSNFIKLRINIQDIFLDISTAIPCGLIINELVSNSLKYAFPKGKGEISISFTYKNQVNILCVKDNGIGMSGKVDLKNSPTLGLLLANSLAKQLDGTLKLEKVKGTSFKITFKKIELKTYGKV